MHKGYLPEFIDHINNDRLDNRIENLRECTRSQNNQNQSLRSDNLTGYKNVFHDKTINRYKVRAVKDGKSHYGGSFEDIEDAVVAATELRSRLHGEFANHG